MSEQDRVLQRALELQAEEEAAEEQERAAEELRSAAQEVGLDPDLLAKAEQDLHRQSVRRRKARRTVLLAGASLLTTVALAAAAARVLTPPAAVPWTSGFEQSGAWTLDVNPGTRSNLRFENEVGRGQVAVVEVERFAAGGNTPFYANLRSAAVPNDVSHHEWLTVDLKGSLPALRVQLEASGSERWVSATIPASANWSTHRLALASFQHEVYEGGRWMSIDDKPPGTITRLSLGVGDSVNGANASGKIVLDDLKLE